MRICSGGLIAVASALALAVAPAVALYEHQPPPAHTGGFGEPSCASCHFDNAVDGGSGSLRLEGVPDTYSPGEHYRLAVVLERAGMQRGGFQMSARFTGGELDGGQAGELRTLDERTDLSVAAAVQYIGHTREGTTVGSADSIRWQVEWVAPGREGEVSFHVAANAANGDASEFGDHIYLHSTASPSSRAEPKPTWRAIPSRFSMSVRERRSTRVPTLLRCPPPAAPQSAFSPASARRAAGSTCLAHSAYAAPDG